jgi:hypothetical protein
MEELYNGMLGVFCWVRYVFHLVGPRHLAYYEYSNLHLQFVGVETVMHGRHFRGTRTQDRERW